MPKESLNLYFSIQDGGSASVLSSLADKTRALDKETQSLAQAASALQQANTPLIQRQNELKTQLERSSLAVQEARKEYRQYGDELHETRLSEAIAEHDELRRKLKDTEDQLKANQKTYNEYREDIRKGGLQDGGSSSGLDADAFGSSLGDVLGGLGIGSMMSDLLGNIANQQISSALGTSMGSAVSGALSSAVSGAALGTAIAPGIGTALGAALGGITGALSGGMDMYAEKDNAFIEYYNSLIDTYGGLAAQRVAGGSSIASNWEDDLRVLSVLLDDDEEAARRFQDSLIELGRTPPFSYDTVSALSKDMLGLGLSTDDALERINALAEAAAALDWSEGSVSTVISNLESAQLAGKLDSRVVKSLSKMGVNVYGALADEFGISEDEILDKLGELDVDRAVDAIYTYLGKHFAGAAAGLTDTYSGASGILASYQDDIAAAAGEGYNTLRTQGLNAEILSLGGALGDAMREINTIIGENQARGENLQELYRREALSAVLLGETVGLFDEGQQAALDKLRESYEYWSEQYAAGNEQAGLKMQSLYEQAHALGQAYYDSSGWAQAEVDVQLEQIEAIRDNTAGLAAATDAYRLSQEKSKGGAAAHQDFLSSVGPGGYYGWYDDDGEYHYTVSELAMTMPGWYDEDGEFHPYAYGLNRVPYDDYPALLHEGERVLTASEARAMDQGGSGSVVQITVSGNNFVGTGEEMADQIAEILVRKLEQADIAAAR